MARAARLAGVVVALLASLGQAADYVWIEAERPTATPAIKPPEGKPDDKGYSFTAWGYKEIISDGLLLNFGLPANEVEKRLPQGGAIFGYDFDLRTPGKYQVWGRIGYEWARSRFDWRLDGAEWKTIEPTQLTCDIQLLQIWNELAWLQFGEQELAVGKHKLELRHTLQTKKDKDGKETPDRILHMTDCFCLYKGDFRPNGKFKPDADYQTAEDKAAAAHVYEAKLAERPEERSETPLTGLWQIARWDEQEVKEETRLRGVEALPAGLDQLFWFGIQVPGDRDKLRPDLAYSHRYIYRAKVKVPAEAKGRGFFLDFQNFNMIATVFVNGAKCGWSKAHSTAWQPDLTAAVKPGEANDLAIVFKDVYYALHDPSTPRGTRHYWNLPHDWLHSQSGSLKFDMPVAWDTRTGILEPVALVVAGRPYTADVFAKPSVKKKELALEITVKNPGPDAASVKIENEIVPWKGGPAEKTFAAKELSVPTGEEKTIELAEAWPNPKLWWPDDPQLHSVVTRLSVDGKAVDVKRTRFGFREWEWNGLLFKLNGVKWPMWADCDYGRSPQDFIERSKKSGMNMVRYWWRDGWGGMTRRQVLDYLDESGMPVRNSGVFDGEVCSYRLVEGEGDARTHHRALFGNWLEQLKAWVKAERNHPAVFVWSIENEIVYINSWNWGLARWVEPAVRHCAEEVMKLDPTRPAMVDGGRCLLDGSLPVNGCHYNDLSGVALRDFPDAAYTRDHWYRVKHRDAWPMIPDRPIFHGECFYANGWTPAEFAALGGERCFIGIAETHPARSLYAKMLSEGWRWADVAAWHFWFGDNSDTAYWNSWQPVAVLCRQWDWTFAGGSTVQRTLKVFNNTRHPDPIEVAWQLRLITTVDLGKKTCTIPPGESELVEISFETPTVRFGFAGREEVVERQKAEFILTCSRGGKEVFREVKPVWVINPDGAPKPTIAQGDLVVLDPHGTAKARLTKRGIPFTEVASIEELPENPKLLIVGKDAVPEKAATDPLWIRLLAGGTRLLVLDQANPLHYQAVPADFEVVEGRGRIAFSEDLSHPAFAGLDQPDFFTWSGDHVVYRNPYRKASRGARSLAQCDTELGCSALAECQLNEGTMLLCQLVVGEKLASDPVAQRLFDNMLNHIAAYKPVRKETAIVADAATPKGKLLRSLGLKHDELAEPSTSLGPGPVAAISGKHGIAVVDATPSSLKALAANLDKVRAFTDKGGWLMLWGLTPDGLADFNKLVGFGHVLRPFQMERVVLATPRDPLTSGLTLRDVVMDDSEKIAGWMAARWAADDAFTCIVDHTDIAPFAKLPTCAEMGKSPELSTPRRDHWPPNLVNGFTADDSWRYCFSILLDQGHKTRWTMELPRTEELTEFSIVLNVIYHKVTKINLYFDDDPKPLVLETRPTHDRQDFALDGRKAKRLTIELADWEKSGTQNVIGIDNLWIGVKRPDAFLKNVKPLLNIGGLVRYNIGQGGIVLNQLNVLEKEKLPINAQKKATITKTLLANLGATFEGGRLVIVGPSLKFTPIALAEGKLNAHVTKGKQEGWFGHRVGDLSGMPRGENPFAGVTYRVPDFRTSPVPSCIILRGRTKEVTGIKVGQKADALFFLHTLEASRQAQTWKPGRREQDKAPPVVFQYVVRYADGKTEEVPVRWGEGVGHWLDKAPKALKSAAIGWSAPFANDDSGDQAVVYSMQWNNPRPDAEIESLDIALGPDGPRWGAPALLAVTAARAAK